MCMQDMRALNANRVYHVGVCAVPVDAHALELQDTGRMRLKTDRRGISEIEPEVKAPISFEAHQLILTSTDSLKVTQSLNEGLYRQMRTSKVRNSVEFKHVHTDSNSRCDRRTWDNALTYECRSHEFVS
jgi:hypothetical protein